MKSQSKRIGLALSGGGIRAALFHMGVLKFLATKGRLEQVTNLSTVSGASLFIGLLLSRNHYRWPSSNVYLTKILPEMEYIIQHNNLEQTISESEKQLSTPNRVILLAEALSTKWGVMGNLQNISPSLDWTINTTSFETGQNFIFSKAFMGDKVFGYSPFPSFPIPLAIASSAAYPVLLGEYPFDTRPYQWFEDPSWQKPKSPAYDTLHLWDGAVYDNFGLDALYKSNYGLNPAINHLLLSDASAPLKNQDWSPDNQLQNVLRIWDVASDQLNNLRVHDLFQNVISKGQGAYIKIGTTVEEIVRNCHIPPAIGNQLIAESLSLEEVMSVRDYPTTIATPSLNDFHKIVRHGYEVAKSISVCYGGLKKKTWTYKTTRSKSFILTPNFLSNFFDERKFLPLILFL